jgi:hypothetical protein
VSTALETQFAQAPLAREYWTSFASLLASHAAMRGIAQPDLLLKSQIRNDGSVELHSAHRTSTVLPPDASGSAQWDETILHFTVDGEVVFGEATTAPSDMEMAVGQILDRVCR